MNQIITSIFGNEWLFLTACALLLLVIAEAGFRAGLRLVGGKDEARKAQVGGIQGAVLSMLGLLLGFTLSFAVGRYDLRRDLVVKEANAIGTTWLRSSLLPDAHQAPVKDLLRRFVDVRLKYQTVSNDPAQLAEGMRLSAEIEAELWKHATAAAKEAPNNITGTFIVTLNETIDTDAERVAAGRAKIPAGVWLLLLIVAASGCFMVGHSAGIHGARTKLGSLFLPLLYTVIILLIFDLAHSLHGFVSVSQQPLLDLQQTMRSARP